MPLGRSAGWKTVLGVVMKKYALILIIILVFGFFVKKHFFPKSAYVRLFTPCGRLNIPFMELEIQGRVYPFKINLDWTRSPLYLSKDLLSRIDKKANGTVKMNFDGEEVEYPTYLLSKVKIGDLILNDIEVMEIPHYDESFGEESKLAHVGLKFFEKNNLLLDFWNSTMILCDDPNKLEQVGYSVQDMIKTPCEVGSKGLVLTVATDLGLVRLGISPANTFSLISSSLVKENSTRDSLQALTTSIFAIGEKNFGNKDLYLYNFSSDYGTDGCIGMDFLKYHVLYLDFKNKIAYIGDR